MESVLSTKAPPGGTVVGEIQLAIGVKPGRRLFLIGSFLEPLLFLTGLSMLLL